MTLRYNNDKIDVAQKFGVDGEQKHNFTEQWPNSSKAKDLNLLNSLWSLSESTSFL